MRGVSRPGSDLQLLRPRAGLLRRRLRAARPAPQPDRRRAALPIESPRAPRPCRSGAANRANPYPLYARLRETPVVRADDGLYIVSTYDEIRSLPVQPKASSHVVSRPKFPRTGDLVTDWIANPIKARILPKYRSLVFRDPPEHDGLRRHIMLQFTPERMQGMEGRVETIINDLIVGMQGRRQIDLVEAFSYPLPVAVICELLGVPAQDERKFHGWSKSLIAGLGPEQHLTDADRHKFAVDLAAISAYLGAIIKEKRRRPCDDVLTGLATRRDKKAGRLNSFDLITTAVSLLVAGHETTVCLITSGILTLLRQPEHLTRLREDESFAPRLVEELVRLTRRLSSCGEKRWKTSTSRAFAFPKAP